MTTVTVKIIPRSKKAKYLLGLIEELSKTDKGIIVYDSIRPNKVTLKAITDAQKGKIEIGESVDELFDQA